MRRLWPATLRSQVLLVIIGALLLAQAVSLWLFADERNLAVRAALARETFDRTASVLTLLDRVPADTRDAVLRAATSPLVRFSIDAEPSVDHTDHAPARLLTALRRTLGGDRTVRLEVHGLRGVVPPMPGMSPEMWRRMKDMMQPMPVLAEELQFSVAMADGSWLNVATRFHRPPLQWAWSEIATFLISAAFILIATWLLLTRITRPLARLSDAADRLGHGDWVDEIPPTGPAELIRLTTAFNRMQARLRRFVDERARLLAALGHDLRSPLTALRVRAEMVDDDETREALIASIDEMQEMTEATLTFARGTATSEPPERVDLADYLAALTGDYAGTGRDVTLELPDEAALSAKVRPVSLRRALRNLIDNALRYGQRARISVTADATTIRLHIDDDGPGIPEAELGRVFEPFVRVETSRSRETGGTGLGLAIARAILRANGGDVTLENRAPRGLRVTVELPRAGADAGRQTEGD